MTDIEVKAINQNFEEAVPDIVSFANSSGSKSFPFVFIDPKGWSGIYLSTIEPLLKLRPGEILINFMTDHIRRFLESPQEETQKSFKLLFGNSKYRERLRGLRGFELEDAAITLYSEEVKRIGDFKYVCRASVLYPEIDKTYFNLLYATRHHAGVKVFKDVEEKAIQVMALERAKAKTRQRAQRSGNLELFQPTAEQDSPHLQKLREKNLERTRESLRSLLLLKRTVSYDEAWDLCVSCSLVWESDLKAWIQDWRAGGKIKLEGLVDRQKVPRLDENNRIVWLDSSD